MKLEILIVEILFLMGIETKNTPVGDLSKHKENVVQYFIIIEVSIPILRI